MSYTEDEIGSLKNLWVPQIDVGIDRANAVLDKWCDALIELALNVETEKHARDFPVLNRRMAKDKAAYLQRWRAQQRGDTRKFVPEGYWGKLGMKFDALVKFAMKSEIPYENAFNALVEACKPEISQDQVPQNDKKPWKLKIRRPKNPEKNGEIKR